MRLRFKAVLLIKPLRWIAADYFNFDACDVAGFKGGQIICKGTIEDIITQKSFDNPALCSNYPVDIHSNKKNASVLYKVCSYEFPLQSLQSKDFENLYAIGKIAGCDFKSHAALRVQSSCMSMGEAVAKDIRKNIN